MSHCLWYMKIYCYWGPEILPLSFLLPFFLHIWFSYLFSTSCSNSCCSNLHDSSVWNERRRSKNILYSERRSLKLFSTHSLLLNILFIHFDLSLWSQNLLPFFLILFVTLFFFFHTELTSISGSNTGSLTITEVKQHQYLDG